MERSTLCVNIVIGEVLDLSQPSPSWRLLRPAQIARKSHRCVAVGGSIYVMGGTDESRTLITNQVESYDTKTSTWSTCGWTLPEPRAGFAASYDPDTGILMIYGGETKTGGSLHTFCRPMNSTNDNWTQVHAHDPVEHHSFAFA
jgi:N-acetylneuraminic acid mutarotase